MNDHERQLIRDLFDRMSAMGPVDRDADADAEIGAGFAKTPDAAYKLVQSVLVQDQALQKAEARIKDLETRLGGDVGTAAVGLGDQPRRSSGLTGAAVPSAGVARPAGGARNGAAATNRDRPQSGGFMAQAMSTAAGVAGGMLLASGISSLFSSDASANDSASQEAAAPAAGEQAASQDANDQADPAELQQAIGEDAAAGAEPQEADYEGDGFGDWGDFGDIDI